MGLTASAHAPARRDRLACLLAAALVAGSLIPGPGPARAQTDCTFALGFKVLRDRIPEIVGDCLEDERFNPDNDNVEQRTTGGLLVWRKADNWTAFTNGVVTWINGPDGLVSRSNADPLFPWETAAAPAPVSVPVSEPVPAPVPVPVPVPVPMPLISRGAPAFAFGGEHPPGEANDARYDTQWRSHGLPAWLAYDLSGLPPARRGRVVVAWYGSETAAYDQTVRRNPAPDLPAAYTLEANAAPGGASPPTANWVTLVSVTGNAFHSRQHVVDLTGYNWVRLQPTEASRPAPEQGVRFNLDVHDAAQGLQDDWIFYGDSITAGAMNVHPIGPTGTFAQLVQARLASHFPVQQGGGIGGLRSIDGARLIDRWLAIFPGRYVGLSYGTNDANREVSPDTFYTSYELMVQAVIAAGKTPLVPKIPWAKTASVRTNAPALNAKIDQLYAAYPEIIPGPDFWTYFLEHPDQISGDDLHPTDAGYAAYRQQWVDAMLRRVYRAGN